MEEIWKDIKGYENMYQISNFGRVKSLPRKYAGTKTRILKPHLEKDGYLRVKLSKNNKSICCKVHRLVCESFIKNPNNLDTVNHIDKNKQNNNVLNLEWMSNINNIRYSQNKKVVQYDKNYNLIKEFNSMIEAQNELKINKSNICQCCLGKRKTAGGYIWKYKD